MSKRRRSGSNTKIPAHYFGFFPPVGSLVVFVSDCVPDEIPFTVLKYVSCIMRPADPWIRAKVLRYDQETILIWWRKSDFEVGNYKVLVTPEDS